MAVSPNQLFAPAYIPAVETTAYTSVNVKTRIDYMAFVNLTASPETFSVNIGPPGSNQRIIIKAVLPGETYLCPEVIGALLMPGDVITYVCSNGAALYGSANGVIFTI